MKQLGVGLATAILLDATLVRAVLLPATMKLLGDSNWYLPKKLDWLPRVSHGTPALELLIRPDRPRSPVAPPPGGATAILEMGLFVVE